MLYNGYRKEKIHWKKIKENRCPMEGCGALLKEFGVEDDATHQCTACDFKISHFKYLRIMTPLPKKSVNNVVEKVWVRRGYGKLDPNTV